MTPRRRLLLGFAAISVGLAPLWPHSAETAQLSVDVDTLQFITHASGTGTNVTRARIETRALDAAIATDRMNKALQAAASCPLPDGTRIAVQALPVRDFVGDTGSRLSGFGLYISIQPPGERGLVDNYIAPFVSLKVDIHKGDKLVDSFEIAEFERVPVSQTTNLDFVRDNPAGIASAILSFAQKTMEGQLRKRRALLCAN